MLDNASEIFALLRAADFREEETVFEGTDAVLAPLRLRQTLSGAGSSAAEGNRTQPLHVTI